MPCNILCNAIYIFVGTLFCTFKSIRLHDYPTPANFAYIVLGDKRPYTTDVIVDWIELPNYTYQK